MENAFTLTHKIDLNAIDITDILTPVIARDGMLHQVFAYCTLAEFINVTAQWAQESVDDAEVDADMALGTIDDFVDVFIWSSEWAESMCTHCGIEITEKEKK